MTKRTIRLALTSVLAVAIAAGLIGPAGARDTEIDFGSGQIGDWTKSAHGTIGDVTEADGDPVADVFVVGDSITTLGRSDITAAIAAEGHTVAINYWSGRPTAPAVDWVLSLTTKPKILVMATGTNDIFDPSVMSAQITRLLAGVPSTTKVLWVDTHASRWSLSADVQVADQRNSGWVNVQIHDKLGSARVIPWSMWLQYRGPSYITHYLSDGVHPKAGTGTAFWAEILMKSIRPLLATM
ncbi:SGNH/GDSL hydrolase family protein [Kribbella sp. NBC_01245]|uniref:SGNH/GDSL hydrolase family protein n=1 Tax=Kribbella sp. NBC_01245 TaxID=2903578 RepID=UPI002E2D156C|nr:SGNH/GDSL hydrolase family protein [Kribbella sp. NBC_01245]